MYLFFRLYNKIWQLLVQLFGLLNQRFAIYFVLTDLLSLSRKLLLTIDGCYWFKWCKDWINIGKECPTPSSRSLLRSKSWSPSSFPSCFIIRVEVDVKYSQISVYLSFTTSFYWYFSLSWNSFKSWTRIPVSLSFKSSFLSLIHSLKLLWRDNQSYSGYKSTVYPLT